MPAMKNQHIAKLEAHLEQIIESAFVNLFGKRIHAQDIALRLTRAMEDGLLAATGSDPRPLAPDDYVIYLNRNVHQRLLERHPQLSHILGEHIVELANQFGYRLNGVPQIKILADATLESADLNVSARHTDQNVNSTAAMERVQLPPVQKPLNPVLIVNQSQTIPLDLDVVNIGRHHENQVVIDDPYVSRHHAQLRLRFGAYMLFDVPSQAGTFVNNIPIREYRLRSGDIIRLGRSQIIYLEDDPTEGELGQTDSLDPL